MCILNLKSDQIKRKLFWRKYIIYIIKQPYYTLKQLESCIKPPVFFCVCFFPMRCSFSKGSSVYFSPSLSFPAAKQRRLRVIKIIQVTMKECVRVPCLLSREFPCMLAVVTVRYFPCERVWKNSSEKHLKVDSQQKPTDRNKSIRRASLSSQMYI